jgi:hypothetical protein
VSRSTSDRTTEAAAALLAWLENQPKPATQPAIPRGPSPDATGATTGLTLKGAEPAGSREKAAAHALSNSETVGPVDRP